MQALQPTLDLLVRIYILARFPGTWSAHLISSPILQLGPGAVLAGVVLKKMVSRALAVSQLREVRLTQSWELVKQILWPRPPPGHDTVGIPHSRQDLLPVRIFPSPHFVTRGDFEGKKRIYPLGQCCEALPTACITVSYESTARVPALVCHLPQLLRASPGSPSFALVLARGISAQAPANSTR